MELSGYAIITTANLVNKNLSSNDKIILAIITSLTQKEGYCFATNKYISEVLGVSERTITTSINKLVSLNLIVSEIVHKKIVKGKEKTGTWRSIYVVLTPPSKNCEEGVENSATQSNNIQKNILSNIDNGQKAYGNELVNYAISEFERVLTYPPTSNRGQTARQGAWNWVRSIQAQLKGKPDSEMSLIVRRLVTSELEWVKRQEWGQITNFAPLSKNLYKFIALLRDGKERLRDAVQETR